MKEIKVRKAAYRKGKERSTEKIIKRERTRNR